MLSRIDLRGRTADARALLPRAEVGVAAAEATVAPIVDDVAARGRAAVLDWSERLDGVRPEPLRATPTEIAAAVDHLEPALRSAIEAAITRARVVHEAQRRPDVTVEVAAGARVTQRWVPVRRVGLYVPGGRVVYPSSVVMNVVPAQVAGVESLAVVSPPQRAHDGRVDPTVLAACGLLGVDEVWAVGGAQAVAMLAAGTEDCAAVDVVTGPGNVYVTAAKRLLRGRVGIDAEAGPTEIAVLADDTADPDAVAADLVAQAEHDPLAACLLVTPSTALADAVDAALAPRVAATPHRERVETALAGQSGIALVDDVDAGVAVVDEWAAEHLEVITVDAAKVADRVRNAGAIFVGGFSPVSLGDYLAGSNHVLPTGGSARHSAGLSVASYLRLQHVVDYDRAALAEVAPHVTALGTAEDLHAHVEAVATRLR